MALLFINHIISKITVTTKFLGNEKVHVNNIVKEMAKLYATLVNEYKFEYQTVFSAGIVKQNENDQYLDEIDFYNNLNNNQNLTQSDFDNIDIRSQLERRIQNQNQDTIDSGWRFVKIDSMTRFFYKTTRLNGSTSLKIPLRSSAFLNIENEEKILFPLVFISSSTSL